MDPRAEERKSELPKSTFYLTFELRIQVLISYLNVCTNIRFVYLQGRAVLRCCGVAVGDGATHAVCRVLGRRAALAD